MNEIETKSAIAFSKQAPVFDEIYSSNKIIHYKRERVREHFSALLHPAASILELNSGTGEDAVFFARKGHHVHATDISEEMQKVLLKKVEAAGLDATVSREICSFNSLADLKNTGPFDAIFSNFAGLNCTNELSKVISSFDALLKPGGIATLVIMPGFCLWEFMLLFKGRFSTSFRRLFAKKGAKAKIDGEEFKCWYYSPGYIKKHLPENFSIIKLEGLCTIVPPSYLETFPDKHPKLFDYLIRKEKKLKSKWPWRIVGDYYIISFRKGG